jgi:hypothetical protein
MATRYWSYGGNGIPDTLRDKDNTGGKRQYTGTEKIKGGRDKSGGQ